MKKKEGFAVRRLGREAMIVAESVGLVDFDRIVSLNSSAEYVWESLPEGCFSMETVAGLLTRRYDVDRETAGRDAEELVRVWLEAGIIEE